MKIVVYRRHELLFGVPCRVIHCLCDMLVIAKEIGRSHFILDFNTQV